MADRELKKSKSLMMMFLLCIIASHRAIAAPQPMSLRMIYPEDYELASGLPSSSQIFKEGLVDRLKQMERREEKLEKDIVELAEDQMEMQALIDAKVRMEKEHPQRPEFSEEDPETLPVPAAVYHTRPLHPGKRTSYMALCHFKICNMGRKRQM